MCRDVRDRLRPLVTDHLDRLDQQITDLRHFRDSLSTALARLDALPSRSTPCDPACLFPTSIRTPRPPGAAPVNPAADPPIACTPTGSDYRQRADQWREVLIDTRPEWTAETAVRTTVPIDRLPALTALIAAESRCCPFFTFHLTVAADGVQLDTSAPADARPLLDELFVGTRTGSSPEGVSPPAAPLRRFRSVTRPHRRAEGSAGPGPRPSRAR